MVSQRYLPAMSTIGAQSQSNSIIYTKMNHKMNTFEKQVILLFTSKQKKTKTSSKLSIHITLLTTSTNRECCKLNNCPIVNTVTILYL